MLLEAEIHQAGFSDAQVIETVNATALSVLPLLLNNLAPTDVDLPVVSADDLEAAA